MRLYIIRRHLAWKKRWGMCILARSVINFFGFCKYLIDFEHLCNKNCLDGSDTPVKVNYYETTSY